MKYEKGSAFVVVLLAIIIIALLAGGLYYYFNMGKNPDYQIEQEQIIQINQDDQSQTQWQIYTNEKYNYSLSYPEGWYFYTEGFNPPPPAGVMIANMPEGSDFDKYTSFEVNSFDSFEGNLEEYPEVISLTDQKENRSEIKVDGKNAIKFESEDSLFKNITIYVKYNSIVYRFGYQIPLKDNNYAQLKTVCDNMVGLFNFK